MTIAEFFLQLATDSELLARFNEDAESAVRRAGLGEDQIVLLLSGNLRKLRVKIKAEIEIDGEIVAFGTVHTVPITVHMPPPPPSK